MFKEFRKEIEWAGQKLVLETGKIARQADGAVMATLGESKVLCTVVGEKSPKPGLDFFPLSVHYVEKTFAAGKIPGGFFKREGRPSERETLTSRLIDRPIRPLFVKGFKNETQVICTVVSHDLENETDILAMIGTSAALTISGLPFMGPIGGARVGRVDGELVLNPTLAQMAESDLDLVVAGTQEGVLMVESEASELSEQQMLEAVMFGHRGFQPVIDAIIDLAEACAKEPMELPEAPAGLDEITKRISDVAADDLRAAYGIKVKSDRQAKLAEVKKAAAEKLQADDSIDQDLLAQVMGDVLKGLEKDIVRNDILDTGVRIDSRDTKTVRPIASEVGILPRAHGSALFTRGETQAMVTTTLGTGQDEQIIDGLADNYRESFMLHYNFPPFSVGEAGRFGFTGRREVGHGKLAWRAMHPIMPSKDEFPYTIRVVSDITESNGSSSMATVCGTSLSLMDAGVPLPRPVAGIAMGLIKEGDRYAVLSDILGDEDHLGDMDFKVAGTENGVTSLQMDIKITSITEEIMQIALDQAREGRLHILGEMAKALTNAREQVSGNAPRITSMQINPEKIRDIIGPGGKVIREICETTGAKIDVEDDGSVRIAAVDAEAGERAANWIRDIVAEPEVGVIYDGKVVKVVDFGAFVNFLGPRDGLVHISEMAEGRVEKVTDVVNEGDQVKVKLIGIDDRGKVKLSMRVVDQETGEDITEQVGERKKRA
jgi:polyribonucleotide nucleotidyltransferase